MLADKIITLRKKAGWSQEELAEKLDVSRQAVSKWEAAQSVPDLDKILKLSELFGVSTDALLKDNEELPESGGERTNADDPCPDTSSNSTARRVSEEQAFGFIVARRKASILIAIGTVLCILSPICLILSAELADLGILAESLAVGVGIGVLLVLVAVAVVLFLICGRESEPYEFLRNEDFLLSDSVRKAVRREQDGDRNRYFLCNMIGTVLCILAVVPLIVCAMTENPLLCLIGLSIMLVMVAVGVYLFVFAGVRRAAFEVLLEEGDFAPARKKADRRYSEVLATVYWSLVTAGYLAYSFITMDWAHSWIVWPVAGVLYGALAAIVGVLGNRSDPER